MLEPPETITVVHANGTRMELIRYVIPCVRCRSTGNTACGHLAKGQGGSCYPCKRQHVSCQYSKGNGRSLASSATKSETSKRDAVGSISAGDELPPSKRRTMLSARENEADPDFKRQESNSDQKMLLHELQKLKTASLTFEEKLQVAHAKLETVAIANFRTETRISSLDRRITARLNDQIDSVAKLARSIVELTTRVDFHSQTLIEVLEESLHRNDAIDTMRRILIEVLIDRSDKNAAISSLITLPGFPKLDVQRNS